MKKILIPIIILFTIITRLIPHPPNFTPIIAIAIFSGSCLMDYRLSLLIILSGMFISDLFLGLHDMMIWVYLSLIFITMIGLWLNGKHSIINCSISLIGGSLLFFLISNFGVWVMGGYEKTFFGLMSCYIMAIPFFHNSLAGTIIYGSVMFGGYELIKNITKDSIPDSI